MTYICDEYLLLIICDIHREIPTAKQIAFGIVWCLVFYFGLCMIVGAVAGGMAASNMQPGDDPSIVGAQAGAHAVQVGRLLIAAGAVFFASAGTILEILPGTRVRRTISF